MLARLPQSYSLEQTRQPSVPYTSAYKSNIPPEYHTKGIITATNPTTTPKAHFQTVRQPQIESDDEGPSAPIFASKRIVVNPQSKVGSEMPYK
jgi:hypothetical protein